MKKISKIMIVLTCLLCIGSLAGCNLGSKKKDFKCDDFVITLTDEFIQKDMMGTNLCLQTNTKVVAVTKNTTFSSYTLSQFTSFLDSSFSVDLTFTDSKTTNEVEFAYTEYENTGADDVEYSYLTAVYKNEGTFWMIDFACKKQNTSEKMMTQFLEWAQTVRFESTQSTTTNNSTTAEIQ